MVPVLETAPDGAAHGGSGSAERRLDEVEAVARIGSYSLHVRSGRWVSTAGLDAILGIDRTYRRTIDGWASLLHPADRAELLAYLAESVEQGRPFDRRYRIVRPDTGAERWVHGRGTFELDADGRPLRMLGTIADVTELHRIESHDRKLAQAVEHAADAILITSPTNEIEYVNPAFERLSGHSRAELVGRDPGRVLGTPRSRHEAEAMGSALRSGGSWVGDLVHRPGEGTERITEASISPVRDADWVVTGFVAVERDVTEERAARAERVRLAAAVEQSPDAFMVADTDGVILYANRAFAALTESDRDALRGTRTSIFDDPRVAGGETLRLTAIDAVSTTTGGPPAIDEDGRAVDAEWLIAPLRDASGELAGHVAIARDRSKERALEAQIRRMERLEVVGQLAGGIAHDFNNLLTTIGAYAQLLGEQLPADDPARADVDQISAATERGAVLVRHLLAFSGRQIVRTEVLDLNPLVDGLVPMLRRLLDEQVELTAALDEDPCLVRADSGQMEQVIVNLAVNARDAMPDGGRLSIVTTSTDIDGKGAKERRDVRPGPYVLLTVTDTGIGMDDATLGHIFEPFFTTKAPDRGTGLGLATVHGIVTHSGGHIRVESAPGAGTTFEIYLPRVIPDPAPDVAL